MSAQPCVSCDFMFKTGGDGERILAPEIQFLRLGRTSSQTVPAFNEVATLTWPDTREDQDQRAPGCSKALVKEGSLAIRFDVTGWYQLHLGLRGEFPAGGGTSGAQSVGVEIRLREPDQVGDDTVIAGDVSHWTDNGQRHLYNCSIERRFTAGDTVRGFYVMYFGTGERPEDAELPGSTVNNFSARLIRRS